METFKFDKENRKKPQQVTGHFHSVPMPLVVLVSFLLPFMIAPWLMPETTFTEVVSDFVGETRKEPLIKIVVDGYEEQDSIEQTTHLASATRLDYEKLETFGFESEKGLSTELDFAAYLEDHWSTSNGYLLSGADYLSESTKSLTDYYSPVAVDHYLEKKKAEFERASEKALEKFDEATAPEQYVPSIEDVPGVKEAKRAFRSEKALREKFLRETGRFLKSS